MTPGVKIVDTKSAPFSLYILSCQLELTVVSISDSPCLCRAMCSDGDVVAAWMFTTKDQCMPRQCHQNRLTGEAGCRLALVSIWSKVKGEEYLQGPREITCMVMPVPTIIGAVHMFA